MVFTEKGGLEWACDALAPVPYFKKRGGLPWVLKKRVDGRNLQKSFRLAGVHSPSLRTWKNKAPTSGIDGASFEGIAREKKTKEKGGKEEDPFPIQESQEGEKRTGERRRHLPKKALKRTRKRKS